VPSESIVLLGYEHHPRIIGASSVSMSIASYLP